MNPAPTGEADFDGATAMAGRALQLMSEHDVPATPQNFETWFTFARGTSPELTQIINILIGNKRAFDTETNRSLFLTYVGGEAHWTAEQAKISEQLRGLVDTAHSYLATSIADSRDHVAALGGVASQIERDLAPRDIIEGLVAELSRSLTRATKLEASFSASLQELGKIRSTLAAVEQRSRTDALTGLANRHALDDFLRLQQIAAMESGQPLSIFLIDVDHFKQFNDRFGHQFGDQVLRLIAQVLKDGVRDEDLAARYGGEEMIGILPGIDIGAAVAIAERIRQIIANREIKRRSTGELLSRITVSIGVAQFVPGETLASLFERCDRALYAAKRGGRNRTVTELELAHDSAAA